MYGTTEVWLRNMTNFRNDIVCLSSFHIAPAVNISNNIDRAFEDVTIASRSRKRQKEAYARNIFLWGG